MNCKHEKFNGTVAVGRITDRKPIEFLVDVSVYCEECGMNFEFGNLAAVSDDRLTLRHQILPKKKTTKLSLVQSSNEQIN